MVVDACQVVLYLHFVSLAVPLGVLLQLSSHVLGDLVQGVKLLLVLHKHIRINFVDENLESY